MKFYTFRTCSYDLIGKMNIIQWNKMYCFRGSKFVYRIDYGGDKKAKQGGVKNLCYVRMREGLSTEKEDDIV